VSAADHLAGRYEWMYRGPVIDTDVHHTWKSDQEIIERMPKKWRDFIEGPGGGRRLPIGPPPSAYQHVRGVNKRLDTFPPTGGPPGSDYETLRRQLLDPFNIERCILDFDTGLNAALPNPYLSLQVVRAINDWNAETWLALPDERIHGAVLVPSAIPEEGAREIRRAGRHPRIAEALLIWNSLGKAFGHPLYNPIFKAAAEMNLPVAIHAFGAEQLAGVLQPAGGGRPPTRLEFHTLYPQVTMGHLASLLVHGVFEKFPTLKVVIVETGVAWVPWLLWSLDRHYPILRRESPWVRKLPSEYFREHIKITTQPLEMSPDPDQLMALLEAYGGIDDVLCFASDYPHWDADAPTFISRRVPPGWSKKVFYENALGAFRWSSKSQPVDSRRAAAAG
jgi:uncharacterized protein